MNDLVLIKPTALNSGTSSLEQLALGGALEGAEQFDRETVAWLPSMRSPDQDNNAAKPLADARGRDMVRNDGYAAGAATLHKDNIVGSQFRLNAKPNWRLLGLSPEWAEEYQQEVESRFTTVAESDECWLDASRHNTFTGLIRLGVGGYVITGEVLATAEWLKNDASRPCNTAIQMVSPDRLSNPMGVSDDKYLRRGIRRNDFGEALSYFFRSCHPTESYSFADTFVWKEVAARKPWGRRQVIHILEQLLPDQSRGIADIVAVLKQMKMTKKFQDITLQNAVINATYAAAIESELPSADVFAAIGAGASGGPIEGMNQYLGGYMTAMTAYTDGAKNIAIDGAKIPHLFPGTKLHLQPVGTPGGVGTGFEQSMLRHIAAALGLSYEQFSRDYTQTNYSSARASMNETNKFMQARKKLVADRFASSIYTLWIEEEINARRIALPKGKNLNWFYQPLVKEALCRSEWIGAGRGQIDELKETQSAILRIKSGLSTYEKECARLGDDFRDTFEQRAREEKLISGYGLSFALDTSKQSSNSNDNQNTDQTDNQDAQDNQDTGAAK